MHHNKRKPSRDVPRHSNPPPIVRQNSNPPPLNFVRQEDTTLVVHDEDGDGVLVVHDEYGDDLVVHEEYDEDDTHVVHPEDYDEYIEEKHTFTCHERDNYNSTHSSLDMMTSQLKGTCLSEDFTCLSSIPPLVSRIGILNSQDMDAQEAASSLPKGKRPIQPDGQREYFERLWTQNFERSLATSSNSTPTYQEAFLYIPVGASASLLCINGFSPAREVKTGRIYTVYRLELECNVNEKRWTIYRRYQDFKQLSDTLKTKGYHLPVQLPPKTLLRSFGLDFLNRRQNELQKWLQTIMSSSYIAGDVMDSDTMRRFLTHMANQPPVFEEVKSTSSRSGSGTRSNGSGNGSDLENGSSTLGGMRSSCEPEGEMEGGSSMDTPKMTVDDFDLLRVVGKGSFGKVLLVRRKETSELFAMKILSKPTVVKKKQVEHTRTERRVLANVRHPFIVQLHYAFQTHKSLYFLLDYCPGGDMFFHLSRFGCFGEGMARFYAAEITLALLHLHELGVIYRDLKPENIMLDVEGHVKLADFGLAKEGITGTVEGTHTMCGTPEYLPPEILNRTGHGKAVDWWNLGMVLYELLTGRPPWYTTDRMKLFLRLRKAKLEFPENMSSEARSLIGGLLNRDPSARLGSSSPEELLSHPFFAGIDWTLLYHRDLPPPYQPCQLTDPATASNFETVFTDIPVHLELEDTTGSTPSGRNSVFRAISYTFQGFTYEGTHELNNT